MRQQKKNQFFTFLLSFLPGAAEMYMGFMRNGISMMAVFCLSIVIPSVLRISDVFVLFTGLIWFYSFFHARNIAACNEEDFQKLEDDFIWSSFVNERNIKVSNPTLRKWGAGILIIFGVVLLWQNMSRMIYRLIPDSLWDIIAPLVDQVPEVVIAVLIIYIGVHMIMGKKEELDGDGK